MTLATHILVAGAITRPFLGIAGNPLIFIIAIVSHYLSDAIPHFDYKLKSIEWKQGEKHNSKINPNPHLIAVDLLNIAIDASIGGALLIIIAKPEATIANLITYGLIMLGAILPDALQPIFIMWKKFPMVYIQNLHDFWHAKTRLTLGRLAIVSQGAIFIIASYINSI